MCTTHSNPSNHNSTTGISSSLLMAIPYILSVSIICSTHSTSFASHAIGSEETRWSNRIEYSVNVGTEDAMSRFDILAPMLSRDDLIVYMSAGGGILDRSMKELNATIGSRYILGNNSILGAYASLEKEITDSDNEFSRVIVGGEWFGEFFDLRFNAHIPDKILKETTQKFPYDVEIVDGSTQFFSTVEKEQLMPGFHGEFGVKGNYGRLYARAAFGGYYFGNDEHDVVRKGINVKLDFLSPERWLRARTRESINFLIGTEMRYDDVNGSEILGSLKLNVGFAGNKITHRHQVEHNMTSMPLRDSRFIVEKHLERSNVALRDTGYLIVNATDGNGHLQNVLDAAGENAVIILDGSAGDFITTTGYYVYQGQILIGGGSIDTYSITQKLERPTMQLIGDTSSNTMHLSSNSRLVASDIMGRNSTNDGEIIIVDAQNVLVQDINAKDIALNIQSSDQITAHGFYTESTVDISSNRPGIKMENSTQMNIDGFSVLQYGRGSTNTSDRVASSVFMNNNAGHTTLSNGVINNSIASSKNGISFAGSGNLTLDGVIIRNHIHGLRMAVAESLTLKNCLMENSKYAILLLSATSLSSIVIDNSTISVTSGHAIHSSKVSNVVGTTEELRIINSAFNDISDDIYEARGSLPHDNLGIFEIKGSTFHNIEGRILNYSTSPREGAEISITGSNFDALRDPLVVLTGEAFKSVIFDLNTVNDCTGSILRLDDPLNEDTIISISDNIITDITGNIAYFRY